MATEAGGAAHSAGMPQLDFSTYANQIFWLVLALVAIYLLLTRIALPRIGAVLAERRESITNDLAAAEELRHKAKAAEASYQQALTEARNEAQRIIALARAEIQADLDAALAQADAEIGARAAESERLIAEIRANALESITAVAKDTTIEIVAALGGKADKRTVSASVSARMKEQA
jgi:F-type H+-transporting ATPase subunit b